MNPLKTLLFAVSLAAVVACGSPSNDVPMPLASDLSPTVEFKSPDGLYSFRHPVGWSVEPLNNGVLLMAPDQEADWQANLYFEPGSDPEARSMADALNDYSASLQTAKADFKLIRIDSLTTDTLSAGRIVYRHTDSGTPLIGWELIVPPPNGNNRLFITAATAESLQDKYLPVFEAVVKSVNFNG